jgi:hypothetical protein
MFRIQSRVSALALACSVLASGTALAGTPMYRFYRATTGEHFYTATFSEGVNAGFKSEGIGFRFYDTSAIGRIPIYRCLGAGWHFISTLSNCEGTTVEGQYGWIDSGQLTGTVALKRFYRTAGGDHFYTTDAAEEAEIQTHGYVFEFVVGYVPALATSSVTGTCNSIADDTSVLQTAITNAAGGHLTINAGSGPCMVSGLSIPSNTWVTVNATLKFLPGLSGALNFDGTRNILNVYGASSVSRNVNVIIDGTGVLDGNRTAQNFSSFMAGIGSLFADNLMIIRPTTAIAVWGLTVVNTQNSPINVVATNGSVIQDVTASDSGNPVEFANDTSNCSADGLHIFNIDPPGVTSEAGFAFYGGPHSCALRNSIISTSTFGVLVFNDACQGLPSHDIVVENVEVYSINSVGAGLYVNTDYTTSPICPTAPTAVNYNAAFNHIRIHNTATPYANGNGTNVTFTDIDLSGSTTSKSQIVGYIDGFGATGGGAYDLYGWSCTLYDPDSVYVALYVGSTGVGWFRANQLSEPAVASACTSGGVAHRYVIHFSAAQISAWHGQVVSVFGISPWAFANNALVGTGSVVVP